MEDEEPQQLNISSPEELEIHERMYLMMKPLQSAISISVVGAAIGLVFAIFMMDSLGNLKELVYQSSGNVPIEDFNQYADEIVLWIWIILVGSGGCLVFYVLKMRPVQKKLDALRREFTKESYFLTLGLTSHGKDVALDVFDAMFEIFPELKETQISSFEKTGYSLDMHPHEIADRKGGIYLFDAAEKTKHGYFLIKHFSKESVNIEDLEECTKIAKTNFKKRGNPYVMRLVCLAKKFDDDALSKYKKLLNDKENPPVDLIIVTENGYIPLKISERVVDR